MSQKTRGNTVRALLKIIEVLIEGPVTARQVAEKSGVCPATAYNYIKTIGEFLPVHKMDQKNPVRFWLE